MFLPLRLAAVSGFCVSQCDSERGVCVCCLTSPVFTRVERLYTFMCFRTEGEVKECEGWVWFVRLRGYSVPVGVVS